MSTRKRRQEQTPTGDIVLDILLKKAGKVGRQEVLRAYGLGVDPKVCRKAAYMLSRPILFREAFRLLDKHVDAKRGITLFSEKEK